LLTSQQSHLLVTMAEFHQLGGPDEENAEIKRLNAEVVRLTRRLLCEAEL